MTDQNKPKRTRRTPEQMAAAREEGGRSRTTERVPRQEIRQRIGKPLKLDVSSVQRELEKQLGKPVQMKWVRYSTLSYNQEIGWEVVSKNLKDAINKYTPDGRLRDTTENIQNSDGGALTADVGNGEVNFLMYKDLEQYVAEDVKWSEDDAARPMDSIQNSAEMGERASLGGDVKSYQPKQQVKIEKRSEY